MAGKCAGPAAGRTIPSRSAPTKPNRPAPAPRPGDPGWVADYRSAGPKLERKIEHLMRRRQGGRRARVRGATKAAADFSSSLQRSTGRASVRSDCDEPPFMGGSHARMTAKTLQHSKSTPL